MFQKEAHKNTVPVELTSVDGKTITGRIVVPYGSDLVRVLNGNSRFLEFEDEDGTVHFIAKDATIGVVETKTKKPPKLHHPSLDETQSAYRVLNVSEAASHEEVRAAYAQLAKRYHPDQYATVVLPKEVSSYMARMFEHISMAYQSITRRAEMADAAE